MTGARVNRRRELNELLPRIVAGADVMSLRQIYVGVKKAAPWLVDDEPDPAAMHRLKWEHDVRWEIETLVASGVLVRRRELGRGLYSVS
jgi:hypothetical protein